MRRQGFDLSGRPKQFYYSITVEEQGSYLNVLAHIHHSINKLDDRVTIIVLLTGGRLCASWLLPLCVTTAFKIIHHCLQMALQYFDRNVKVNYKFSLFSLCTWAGNVKILTARHKTLL